MNWPSLNNVKTLAIVCTQWGDTGKGKLVDYFAEWADIIARGTGGANAGHTICLGGKQHVFHLVPSGILHTDKINIIGSGVVLDPKMLVNELCLLEEQHISYHNLMISLDAKLVLPQHRIVECRRESGIGKIGTTGRGIGPAYEDHYRRIGLVVNDLLNEDVFVKKFRANLAAHQAELEGASEKVDADLVIHQYLGFGRLLAEMVTDTDTFLRRRVGQSRVLLEGAQGLLLSVDYGTYPFVTSSDASIFGLAKGVGLLDGHVDRTLGIAKAFYMTRVGEGPFPTEMGGERSAKWCNTKGVNREVELKGHPSRELVVKSHLGKAVPDEFDLGVAVRRVGSEYGATTGRPRRTGWFDLPLLRYSSQIADRHGQEVALTKLDVLDHCPLIKICTGYTYTGPTCWVGQRKLEAGKDISIAIPDAAVLAHCHPVYREFPGWMCDISQAKKREDLPENLSKIITFVEEQAGVKAGLLSVGPDREQTIFE